MMIFQAIKDIFETGQTVDILTVTNQLRQSGHLETAGGAYYVTELTSKVNSAANIEAHMRILMEMWIRRLLIDISTRNERDAYDETVDVFELFDKAGRQIMKLQEALSMRKGTGGKANYREALAMIEHAMNNPGITGVPSGIPEIDDATAGWQKQDLIIVAARPGMGKTAFAMSAAVRDIIINQNLPVLVFSFEMSAVRLMMRLIAGESDISLTKAKRGEITLEEFAILQNKSAKLYDDNLHIEDSNMSISELRAKAITHKMKNPNLAMIVVDYLQLMSVDGISGNREQEIATISRSLKLLAKELDIPVMALSQLSRSVETRGGDKRPQLSDLRESGAIEQDADVVIFLYRPEYYKIYTYEDGSSTLGHGEAIISKHRDGKLGDIRLGADMSRLRYYSLRLEHQAFPKPKESTYNPNKFTESGSIDAFDNGTPIVRDEYNKKKDDQAPF